ncbi:MAG TPA: hypothetical protein V6C63_21610 [Allocoleopsis sp.]
MAFGPIPDSTEEQAIANIQELIRHTALHHNNVEAKFERLAADDEAGWFGFKLMAGDRYCHVLMPGITIGDAECYPLAQHVKDFRVYVDGGSWLWPFAVKIAREALLGLGDYSEGDRA